jgi:hypothetical protein
MVTGLILHVSTREQKSVPINNVLKIEIREATIIYCKSKSKFNREARRSLEKELQDLSAHRDSLDITDESLDKRIHDIEKELE